MIEAFRIPAGTKVAQRPDGKWKPVADDDPRATHFLPYEYLVVDGKQVLPSPHGWVAMPLEARPQW